MQSFRCKQSSKYPIFIQLCLAVAANTRTIQSTTRGKALYIVFVLENIIHMRTDIYFLHCESRQLGCTHVHARIVYDVTEYHKMHLSSQVKPLHFQPKLFGVPQEKSGHGPLECKHRHIDVHTSHTYIYNNY